MPTIIDAEIELPLLSGGRIKTISRNGTELPVDEQGNVDIEVPERTSELENDSGYITKDVNNLTNYTKTSDLADVATSGDYDDLNNKPDVDSIAANAASGAVSAHNQSDTAHSDIRNELDTVKDIAEGANIAIVFDSYSDLVTFFNSESDSLKVGTNLYVKTLEVPDLWIASVELTSVSYTYTTDEDFLSHINNNGQIGYYKFSELETQKVDLSNYATLMDLAGKVSKSGDTMSGDLEFDEGKSVILKGSNYWMKMFQSTTYMYITSSSNQGQTWGAPVLLIYNTQNKSIFRGDVYAGGASNAENKLLQQSDGDLRWSQITPPVSTTATLVSGSLNELGTIDFSTISLPSTPGTAEYNCRFTDNSASGGDITQNAGLSSVTKWVGDTTIVTGKSYEMSIQNGWGIITQFD